MSELTIQENKTLAQIFGYTEKQMEFLRTKICKGATDEELEHFFYKCGALKLDPLMGQIYFVKFGNNPGTIIIGIDGYRMRAQATGKLAGIKRGVIRDKNGQCTGAWAQVFRTDWKEPASEEVSLAEYMCNKPNWQKMPETMIKKVAEAAALRMAFPDAYNGIYAEEEMDKAIKDVPSEIVQPRGSQGPQIEGKKSELSDAQIKRMFAIAKSNQVDPSEVKDFIESEFNKSSSFDLTRQEYETVCDWLEHMGKEGPIEMGESEEKQMEMNDLPQGVPWAKHRDPQMVK